MNHKAFEDFISTNPNVRMAKIRGTDFSFFFVPPDVMNQFIAQQIEPSDDYAGPVITKQELGSFQYPQILNSYDPTVRFNMWKLSDLTTG